MSKSEPIRNVEDIEKICNYYLSKNQVRNYVMFTVGIYTSLRISDLLLLKWSDFYNFSEKCFHKYLYITESKIGKCKKIALNKNAVGALKNYLSILPDCTPNTWLFPSNRKEEKPLSRIQAYKIIRKAAKAVGIRDNISCHSMRKVIGYHSWKAGIPPALICDIYGHSSERVTKRYLGIRQDEVDEVYLQQNYKRKEVKNEKRRK